MAEDLLIEDRGEDSAASRPEPPILRERMEDVPALASYLLQLIAGDLKMAPRRLHPNALQQLQTYSYLGNIRELRNLLERACILTSGPEIPSIDLPHKTKTSSSPVFADEFNLRDALAEWERDAIVQTLAKTQGGKAEAARRLGLSKSDITYKLAKYGISTADGEVQS